MPAERGESPVNLLREYYPRQLMRKRHGRKRKQQICATLPFRRQAVVTADHKHKILTFELGPLHDLEESCRIHAASARIEQNLAGSRMPGKHIEAFWDHFTHLAIAIVVAAL